jgi:hypothetical protein
LSKPIPWLRVFVEGAVIVGSILLAFGIEAWWAGHGEAEQREALLRGLSSDFVAAEADLDRVIDVHSEARMAAERVLALARADAPVKSDQAPLIDSLVTQLFHGATFDPPSGTVEAFLAAGGLDVLTNGPLVSELTAWSSVVDNLGEDEDWALEQVRVQLIPFLWDNMIPTLDFVRSDADQDVPWVPLYTDTYRLLADSRFQSVVSERWFSADVALESAGVVRASLKRIRLLVDAELDGGP